MNLNRCMHAQKGWQSIHVSQCIIANLRDLTLYCFKRRNNLLRRVPRKCIYTYLTLRTSIGMQSWTWHKNGKPKRHGHMGWNEIGNSEYGTISVCSREITLLHPLSNEMNKYQEILFWDYKSEYDMLTITWIDSRGLEARKFSPFETWLVR